MKRCGCGAEVDWPSCPAVGFLWSDPELLELRNCPDCFNTHSLLITAENAEDAMMRWARDCPERRAALFGPNRAGRVSANCSQGDHSITSRANTPGGAAYSALCMIVRCMQMGER